MYTLIEHNSLIQRGLNRFQHLDFYKRSIFQPLLCATLLTNWPTKFDLHSMRCDEPSANITCVSWLRRMQLPSNHVSAEAKQLQAKRIFFEEKIIERNFNTFWTSKSWFKIISFKYYRIKNNKITKIAINSIFVVFFSRFCFFFFVFVSINLIIILLLDLITNRIPYLHKQTHLVCRLAITLLLFWLI